MWTPALGRCWGKMKRNICFLCFVILLLTSLPAENLRIKIEGPESSYNQMRITNNTKHSNFDCKVYLLKEEKGKFIIKETLGIFHLKESNDTDSCKMSINKNNYIGITIPEQLGEVSYSISYKDLPFFDIVEITLTDSVIDEYGENPEGKEF